jgi:hypothetical protein
VVGTSRLADESDIPRLPYLEAITKETLRLHPTGPLVVRRSLEPCAVGGYDVPAGATAFVNVWAIGRDPASWAPDPLAGAVPGGGRGRGGGRSRAALPAAAVRVRAADVPRRCPPWCSASNGGLSAAPPWTWRKGPGSRCPGSTRPSAPSRRGSTRCPSSPPTWRPRARPRFPLGLF